MSCFSFGSIKCALVTQPFWSPYRSSTEPSSRNSYDGSGGEVGIGFVKVTFRPEACRSVYLFINLLLCSGSISRLYLIHEGIKPFPGWGLQGEAKELPNRLTVPTDDSNVVAIADVVPTIPVQVGVDGSTGIELNISYLHLILAGPPGRGGWCQ